MKLILSLLLLLPLHVKQPISHTSSQWLLYNWSSRGYLPSNDPGISGDLATFDFPLSGNSVPYPTFLLTQTNVVGNLTGKTLTCTFTITTTGNPNFVWGGDLSGWNTTGLPANARFFISDETGYSNSQYTACPGCFWWNNSAWAQISPSTGTVTISTTFDPSVWSNANGKIASIDLADFNYTISHVKQIGISFGGGSFYDVGVAILNGTGTGTFHLVSFTVTSPSSAESFYMGSVIDQ